MALRVLLADESVTIKKVIQLALQDFAVEVKAVPVGLDVLEVSKSFQPDLVFADILLQKRSGYEVCGDLKKDSATAAIPVVLMWSSFMELDLRQVESCGADGRLEKPFEVEALRKLVLELVPRTRSQRLAHFLEYPPAMTAPLRNEVKQAGDAAAVAPTKPPPSKPKMPPPLASTSTGGSSTAPPPAKPTAESPAMTASFSNLTPAIPERPATPANTPPLGALPDLHLEGAMQPPSGWNMESFEPLDLAPLNLTDDDDDDSKDSFQPIQLPQAEPAPSPMASAASFGAALSLTNDSDDDATADQWSNRSLDKYRLSPLKPDEALALDEFAPDLEVPVPTAPVNTKSGDRTELIAQPPAKKSPPPDVKSSDDLPTFSLSDDDTDRTSLLEIEHIDHSTKTRPEIVRELLRDPDFSYGDETVRLAPRERSKTRDDKRPRYDNSMSGRDVAIDLSSAGEPPERPVSNDPLEAMVMSQVAPQLEKIVEKIVAQLLPQIAERIIKRELERLLEES